MAAPVPGWRWVGWEVDSGRGGCLVLGVSEDSDRPDST